VVVDPSPQPLASKSFGFPIVTLLHSHTSIPVDLPTWVAFGHTRLLYAADNIVIISAESTQGPRLKESRSTRKGFQKTKKATNHPQRMIIPPRYAVLAHLWVLMGGVLFSLLLLMPTTTNSTATTADVSSSSCSVSTDSISVENCGEINETAAFFTAQVVIPREEGQCWYTWQLSHAGSDGNSSYRSAPTTYYIIGDRSNFTMNYANQWYLDYLTLVNPNCTDAFCEAIIRSAGFSILDAPTSFQHRFTSDFVAEGEVGPLDFLAFRIGTPDYDYDQRGGEPVSGTLTAIDDSCTYTRSWSVVVAAVVWPLVGLNIVVVAVVTTTM
jgi:hypothetical protein